MLTTDIFNTHCFRFAPVTPEKADSVDEEADNNGVEAGEENAEDGDKKTIKVKPYGGPLIVHP